MINHADRIDPTAQTITTEHERLAEEGLCVCDWCQMVLDASDIHTRPTLPCPPPSRAMLAAARRHDAVVSAAVLVRPTRSAARTLPAMGAIRVAVATAALLLTPLLARGAEARPAGDTSVMHIRAGVGYCSARLVSQETDSSGRTVVVVHRVCKTPTKK